ncbi:MAG: BlaI/MecI/CopY family transcriptional regulator [Chitinophagaceae bacterium]|jgi:predicted transcriptional regulator|nr:BlaI/MecI/CopY family transcriptional regulator [Chitinophagaceae bacterium]
MSKPLTKAEEQVMQVIWKLENAYLKDVLDNMPEPKPHSNTVATILKILLEKGFVNFEIHGRVHCYHPIVSKEEYSSSSIKSLVNGYFEGSFTDVVSFMVEQKNLKVKDLELLLQQLKTKK